MVFGEAANELKSMSTVAETKTGQATVKISMKAPHPKGELLYRLSIYFWENRKIIQIKILKSLFSLVCCSQDRQMTVLCLCIEN